MARTKVQKKEIIEKLGEIMKGAKSLVFVNVHGLKVSDSTTMRRALKKEGVGFFVAKKTFRDHAGIGRGVRTRIQRRPRRPSSWYL